MHAPRRSVLVGAILVVLVALVVAVPAPVATGSSPAAQRVISVARHQVGDPWVAGSTGPRAFDCSGLVYYAFRQTGLLRLIGGTRRTAAGYWQWFAHHGRASRTNPQPGDLVIWNRGQHIGIYVGRHRAISALVSGVQVHKVSAVTLPFTTYLHVRYPKAPARHGGFPGPRPPRCGPPRWCDHRLPPGMRP